MRALEAVSSFGLVEQSKPEMRTEFQRAERKVTFLGSTDDLCEHASVRQPQFGDGGLDRFNDDGQLKCSEALLSKELQPD